MARTRTRKPKRKTRLRTRPELKEARFLDADNRPLKVGQFVKSSVHFRSDGVVIKGKVVSLGPRSLVEVEHLSGPDRGQVRRCASILWRAASKRERIVTAENIEPFLGKVFGGAVKRTVKNLLADICDTFLDTYDGGVQCRICEGHGLGGASVGHQPGCRVAELLKRWKVPTLPAPPVYFVLVAKHSPSEHVWSQGDAQPLPGLPAKWYWICHCECGSILMEPIAADMHEIFSKVHEMSQNRITRLL